MFSILLKSSLITLLLITLTACGDGGSDTPAYNPSSASLTGSFVDSPVEGLHYETPTFTGETDNQGHFKYALGEKVSFYIGQYPIGEVKGGSVVTPYMLYPSDEDAALKVAQLLQSIDADHNASNGITLHHQALFDLLSKKITPKDINFESEMAVQIGFLLDVSKAEAKEHLDETLALLNKDTTPPVFHSASQINVNENQVNAITLNASDDKSSVSYTLSGADVTSFNFNTTTNKLTFKIAPNYEVKNRYLLTITATDTAGNATIQELTINIMDVYENASNTTAPRTINLDALAQAQGQSVPEYLLQQFEQFKPANFVSDDTIIFTAYSTTQATYKTQNWASQFDFSGVGWDSTKSGTLITDQHILVANHYARGIGQRIIFFSKDGQKVERTIVGRKSFKSYDARLNDACVEKLNAPVPDNVKVYALINPSSIHEYNDFVDAPYLMTDKTRHVFAEKVYSINPTHSTVPQSISFSKSSNYPNFMYHGAVSGDSGNPQFFIINGELVLSGVLYGYANGKMINQFNGFASMYDTLLQAIDDMKNI